MDLSEKVFFWIENNLAKSSNLETQINANDICAENDFPLRDFCSKLCNKFNVKSMKTRKGTIFKGVEIVSFNKDSNAPSDVLAIDVVNEPLSNACVIDKDVEEVVAKLLQEIVDVSKSFDLTWSLAPSTIGKMRATFVLKN